jgi:hypothetical protein
MRLIAIVAIAAGLGLGLTACGDKPLAANCDGTGACKVDVKVTSCTSTATSLTVVPDPLPVTKANNIFWELDSTSTALFQFRDNDGVILKTPDDDFVDAQAQANNKKFKVHDKNSKAKPGEELRYPYSINLQKLDAGNWVDCKTFDPTIVNKG